MLVMTGWAMIDNLHEFYTNGPGTLYLFVIGLAVLVLEAWMLVETALMVGSIRKKAQYQLAEVAEEL